MVDVSRMRNLFFTICAAIVSLGLGSVALAISVVVVHDPIDCTANLQAALDGPADTITIPNVGEPWVTGPISISRDDVTLLLEPGVELVSKLGAFQLCGRSLLQVRLCKNIVIRGFGATFRMLNGIDPIYATDENHHCLELRGLENVLVEGLTFTKAGGDGIYISGGWEMPGELAFSGHVTIRDCVMDDNRRQGISVISAQDLLIERCVMSNTGVTSGTLPMAGIDFEPDQPTQRIVRCVLRDCEIFGNNGLTYSSGILTALLNLTTTSLPVSITIERCHITSTRNSGACVNLSGPKDNVGPTAVISMSDCLIEDTRGVGLFINSGSAKTTVNLTRVVLRNTHTDTPAWGGAPIYLDGQDTDLTSYGNITFTDCFLSDARPRPFIRSFEDRNLPLPTSFCNGLLGNITVVNPEAAGWATALGNPANDQNVTLAVTARTSLPPQTVSLLDLQRAGEEGGVIQGPAVTRLAADLSFPLAVNLDWSGTAQNRLDFGFRPGFCLLPPAATQTGLVISPQPDGLAEGEETAIATLVARPGDYARNPSATAATVRIFDTPLPAWRYNQFQTSQDVGTAGNTADPDGDGASNLLEYALGTRPLDPSSTASLTTRFTNGQLTVSYPRQPRSDLTYRVEAGTDLVTWPEILQTSTGSANVMGTVSVPSSISLPRRFIRLKITTP
jgi:Right handed beta helix region